MNIENARTSAPVDVVVSLRRWRKSAPNADGWWLFREHGTRGTQRILVIDGEVADDQDWEDAIGRPPSSVMSENYWEGNPVSELTDGTLTRGCWMFDRAN